MNNIFINKNIEFKKSTFSRTERCVGVSIQKEKVLLTNTKHFATILKITHSEWRTFIQGIKNNEFDIRKNR